MTGVHSIALRLPGSPEQVAVARRALAAFATEHGYSHRAADVRLAVSEIVTNAIMHGYRDGRSGDVEVEAVLNGRLAVTVRDRGTGVEPRTDSPGLGVGLALAAQVADEVDVRTAPTGGAEIVLVFEP